MAVYFWGIEFDCRLQLWVIGAPITVASEPVIVTLLLTSYTVFMRLTVCTWATVMGKVASKGSRRDNILIWPEDYCGVYIDI